MGSAFRVIGTEWHSALHLIILIVKVRAMRKVSAGLPRAAHRAHCKIWHRLPPRRTGQRRRTMMRQTPHSWALRLDPLVRKTLPIVDASGFNFESPFSFFSEENSLLQQA